MDAASCNYAPSHAQGAERSLLWLMRDHIHPLEKNIAVFNADATTHGGYVYTTFDRWSSRHATSRQTDELIRMLVENFQPSIRIVDIGCGDGVFTMKIAERFSPSAIRGIDPAANAVDAARARITQPLSCSVSFEVGDIYNIESKGEVVAVARGVLHHLDRPQAAIAHLAKQFTAVLALEPNGYNPAMKIIEKTSPYHRRHDEKSYWPATLNRWFKQEGFSVVSQKFFCLVPYFCPTPAARILSLAEPAFEAVPFVRQICCGTNLVLYGASS
jgi:SAM-dependent methyltransferase